MRYYRNDLKHIISRMRQATAFQNGARGFYGLGLFVDPFRGAKRLGHTGLWPGYLTEIIWYDGPISVLISLSNCNAIEPSVINTSLAARIIPDLKSESSAELDAVLRFKALERGPWIEADTYDLVNLCDDGQG